MKHLDGVETCPSCEDKLTRACQCLGPWFRAMKASVPDLHISWSYRGQEDQEEAFRDGKSKCHFPDGPHNRTDWQGKPHSVALDLFEQKNGVYHCTKMKMSEINLYSKRLGYTMYWGGDFKHLGDFDHFQCDKPK